MGRSKRPGPARNTGRGRGKRRARGWPRRTRRRQGAGRARRRGSRSLLSRERAARIAWKSLRIGLLFALPFVLLIRGAVASHTLFDLPGWATVAVGALLAAAWVSAWGTWLWRRMTGRARLRQIALNGALPLVALFYLYNLGWLAHANAKTPQIAKRWSDLHPSLRIAIGSARFADSEFVITEISRSAEDYERMGLRRATRSLHYEQADGWVHAVDLRTRGRSALRNGLARLYFEVMGFDTLRHGGTGDHLHVSLPR